MSPSWYTDIDAWFDRYKFDEDVMLALFQYCFDHKGLIKPYIEKWPKAGKTEISEMLLTLTITPSNTKNQGCSQCHCQKAETGPKPYRV